jgi:hypothetical protein
LQIPINQFFLFNRVIFLTGTVYLLTKKDNLVRTAKSPFCHSFLRVQHSYLNKGFLHSIFAENYRLC